MDVSVEVNIFKGNRDLKYLKDVTRLCWFHNEGNLKWTGIYDHLTCFNECKAEYIFKICDCIPFFYAFKGDEKICTFKDISCLIHNRSLFNNVLLTSNREEGNNFAPTVESITGTRFCYCLPSCDDVLYVLHKDKKVDMKLQNTTTCDLFVYFNNVSGILRLRTVHVTWDTLLAIIGGLFGLCMGGSVVTILELIFFFLQAIFRKSTINSKEDANKQQKTLFCN
ncbi:ion channel [Oryctes borbonicus]|uniref:Ion channel n=1 Tax=Oryctes borbonicus TaxID=1629725 RepID=A0A0T6B4T3_9SCAR|nr:ion channel [Oryctes borbonicus]